MARMPRWLGTVAVLCLLAASAGAKTPGERAEELGLKFVAAPALRQPAYPGMLGNIYARNDRAERWDGFTSLAHEGTHGANSVIRNRYSSGWSEANAMYVGDDAAILISEPNVPLTVVRQYIPRSLTGTAYQTYLVDSISSWNDQTLYLFDEWSAYTNGSWIGLEYWSRHPNPYQTQADSLKMAEFTVYAFAAVTATAANRPNYDLTQMRAAVAWMCECRVLPLLKKPGAELGVAYLQRFRTSPDASQLRQSVRQLFGKEWTKEVLGF